MKKKLTTSHEESKEGKISQEDHRRREIKAKGRNRNNERPTVKGNQSKCHKRRKHTVKKRKRKDGGVIKKNYRVKKTR